MHGYGLFIISGPDAYLTLPSRYGLGIRASFLALWPFGRLVSDFVIVLGAKFLALAMASVDLQYCTWGRGLATWEKPQYLL